MNGLSISTTAAIKRPTAWRYLASGAVAYPVVWGLWLLFDIGILHPDLMQVDVEKTMDRIRWFGIPLAIIVLVFGGSWISASFKADARERAWLEKTRQLKIQERASNTEQSRREYVLEVIGIGVTF